MGRRQRGGKDDQANPPASAGSEDGYLLGSPTAGAYIVVGLVLGGATLIGAMMSSLLAILVVLVGASFVALLLGGAGWLAGTGWFGAHGTLGRSRPHGH